MADLRQPWKVSDVLSGPNVQGVRYVNVVDADDHLIGCVDSRISAKVCAVEDLAAALEDMVGVFGGMACCNNPDATEAVIIDEARAALAKARGGK